MTPENRTPTNASHGAEDASAAIARLAATLRFEDLSPEVVDAAKRGILDTLGVSLAALGAARADIEPVVRLIRDSPATGNVRTFGTGWPVTVDDAVFWIGALSHALDFDDYADIVHPTAPVISAVLPLAQLSQPTDGRRALLAVALGQDLIIRIALSLNRSLGDFGWLPALPGAFGAALGSATLLALDEAGVRNTLGLALHQTAGTMQALASSGSSFRAVREGFNARAGATSARLAALGMRGDSDSIEGPFGLFQQFFNGEYDRDFLLSGLDSQSGQVELLGPRITFKPWPSAGHTHLFLTGLNDLKGDPLFRPDDIEDIFIVGGSKILEQQCEPRSVRVAPPHSIDAKVSIPFLIGKFVRHGTLRIEDFSPEGLHDAPAIDIANKVRWRRDTTLRRGEEGFGPVELTVRLAGGRELNARVEHNLGHPSRPLSWDQLVQKFHECVAASGLDLDAARVEDAVDMIANLDSVSDIGALLRALTVGTREVLNQH